MRKANSDYFQILLVGGTLAAVLVLAVFLVNRESSGAVAADAEVAILSESTMSAASGVLNASNFAVVLGVNGADARLVADARAGAEDAVEELGSRVDRLLPALPADQQTPVDQAYRRFLLTISGALEDLDGFDAESGTEALADQGRIYDHLIDTLADIRDARAGEILIAGEGVGRAAGAVRFLVVFLFPLGIMLALWKATRRGAAERILTEELRHEREVSRSKDAFIADVSHELRTPLTGIYGFALALEDDPELEPPARELVGLIVTEAAELSRMVDDLVAAGRIDAKAISFDIAWVDVCPEILEVVRPFRRQGISVEVDDVEIAVTADQARLRQLIRNLVSNAAKHGGNEIAVTAYRRDGVAVIEVIDDGPGVPAEVEARLFDRYVHSDGSAVIEGSVGLGLAIAKAFAEGMGGSLTYLRADELTIFEVTLPIADNDAQYLAEPELELVAVTG